MSRLLQPSQGKSLGGASLGESVQVYLEDDYKAIAKKHGGKYLGYVQPHQGLYEFSSEDSARKFANFMASKTTATPTVRGKRVSIDEPMLGESGHLGYAGTSSPGRPGNPHTSSATIATPPVGKERGVKRPRSETEKILGIDENDPRSEAWPKLGESMRKLLNLEDLRSLAPKPGFHMDEEPIIEATYGGGNVGGFIGGGMMGMGQLMGRSPVIPSYDASVDLEGSDKQKQKQLNDMLKELGLRGEE